MSTREPPMVTFTPAIPELAVPTWGSTRMRP